MTVKSYKKTPDIESKKQRKPKFDPKLDPSRKNKKYYLQKNYD